MIPQRRGHYNRFQTMAQIQIRNTITVIFDLACLGLQIYVSGCIMAVGSANQWDYFHAPEV